MSDKPQRIWIGHGEDAIEITDFVDKIRMEMQPAGDPEPIRELAGLQDGSLTLRLDNSAGNYTPFGPTYFPPPERRMRVSNKVPDGRWQRIKQWLKNHGLRWLKVRYVTYSFDAKLASWDDFGASFEAASPVKNGLEER